MANIVTFGEIMGRLCPEGLLKLKQALPGKLDVTFGGAESNVAASIAMMGNPTTYITALPKNDLGDAVIAALRGIGVNTENIVRTDDGRLGLYFLETGANQRPSKVVYDRAGSSIAVTPAEAYNFPAVLEGADWFHVTGITPAISQQAAASALAGAKAAKAAGATVSCDLNFRKKLWKWDASMKPRELAEKTMRGILPFVDVVIANEEDAADILSITYVDTDVHAGKLQIDRYPDVAKQIVEQFPNVKFVAITLRESISASHNNWGAMLYDASTGEAHFAPMNGEEYQPYEIRDIVDRVGGGDSFGAGLIFAMTTPELAAPESAIRYAVAASCLAHSIIGDFNYSSRADIEALAGGSASGRVQR